VKRNDSEENRNSNRKAWRSIMKKIESLCYYKLKLSILREMKYNEEKKKKIII